MAKKKKNRKTRKQKITQAQGKQNQANTVAPQAETMTETVVKKSTHKPKVTSDVTSDQLKQQSYAKKDILRSLALTGIILAVFVLLYFVLDKTSVGTQVYKIIKI